MTPPLCIYCEYPRKAAKGYALRCIAKAAQRLQRGEAGEPPCTEREALVRLYRATKAYAASRQGQQQDKSRVPHPSTWYNQGRYLDDPSEWDVVTGGEIERKGKSGQTVDAGSSFLEELANKLGVGKVSGAETSAEIGQVRLRGLR